MGEVELLPQRAVITDTRLLECGFAGEVTPDELEYIIAALRASRDLRFAWGLKPRNTRLSPELVRHLCMVGDPDHREENRRLRLQWQRARKAKRLQAGALALTSPEIRETSAATTSDHIPSRTEGSQVFRLEAKWHFPRKAGKERIHGPARRRSQEGDVDKGEAG